MSKSNFNEVSLDLKDKITAELKNLKGIQQEIADYILTLPTRIVFMTAEEVAMEIGVSPASVVRFAQTLGYAGFAALKRDLRQEIKFFVDPVDRFEKSLALIEDTPDALRAVVETDLIYLKHLLNTISLEQFDQAVEALVRAKRIGICGIGSSTALVDTFSFRMRRFQADVIPMATGGRSLFERLHWLDQGDTLLVFAFLNPSEEVFICLQYAKKMGIKSIVITDLETSLAATLGDIVLIGQRGPVGYFHSLLVPSALVNGLILAYAKRKSPQSLTALRRFQKIRTDLDKD